LLPYTPNSLHKGYTMTCGKRQALNFLTKP
jgi:hypothetical protein